MVSLSTKQSSLTFLPFCVSQTVNWENPYPFILASLSFPFTIPIFKNSIYANLIASMEIQLVVSHWFISSKDRVDENGILVVMMTTGFWGKRDSRISSRRCRRLDCSGMNINLLQWQLLLIWKWKCGGLRFFLRCLLLFHEYGWCERNMTRHSRGHEFLHSRGFHGQWRGFRWRK